MSMKIHNGLRADIEHGDFFEFADTLREVAGTVLEHLQLTELAERSTRYIDAVSAGLEEPGEHITAAPLMNAQSRRQREQTELGSHHALHDPFRFEVQIMASNYDSSTIYLLPFAQHEEYVAALTQIPGVREYGYWNNTDRPDEVSEEDWEKRKQEWDRVLGDDGIPAQHGVNLALSGHHTQTLIPRSIKGGLVLQMKVCHNQPALSDRKRWLAKKLWDRLLEEEKVFEQVSGDQIMSKYVAYVDLFLEQFADVDVTGDLHSITPQDLTTAPNPGALTIREDVKDRMRAAIRKEKGCHATVRLTYTNGGATPYKWEGRCTCGMRFQSWQWIAEDRPGGTLPMVLEHVGLG